MWQVFAGIVQIIFLILKNKFEKDEEKRKEREQHAKEASEIIKSRDVSRLNNLLTRMRQ